MGCDADCTDLDALSRVERTTLECFGNGFSRPEIAAVIGLSVRTIGRSLTTAKEKLGARSLAHAAVLLDQLTWECGDDKGHRHNEQP
jgi:DNA-binding NarL/FixJ family response regulator